MKIELKGYFDSNFGDDYMIKIIAHYLPEFEFVIQDEICFGHMPFSGSNILFEKAGNKLPVLLVVGSGFMVNSSDALKCEIKWFLKGKYIADYCMGCSIEPFDSKLKEFLIRKKLGKFKLIIFRDKASSQWMRKNKNTAIYCLPDIVFSIPEEWIPERGTIGALGISVMNRDGNKPECIYYRSMAAAADYWVQHTGKRVYLMAFDSGVEDDVSACRYVKQLMKHQAETDIVVHKNGDEILKAYSECEKIIGTRYHSAVLAMRMGIDFFPIIYRRKMRELIKDVSYPVSGCDIDNIDFEHIKQFIESKNKNYKLDDQIIRSSKMYAQIFREEYSKRMTHG